MLRSIQAIIARVITAMSPRRSTLDVLRTVVNAMAAQSALIHRNHEEIMSRLDDVNASIATLSASVDSLIAAKGDPAVAAQLQADEDGLDAIKVAVDALAEKITAALTPAA